MKFPLRRGWKSITPIAAAWMQDNGRVEVKVKSERYSLTSIMEDPEHTKNR